MSAEIRGLRESVVLWIEFGSSGSLSKDMFYPLNHLMDLEFYSEGSKLRSDRN